jgi:poly(glycerol-phosphate) alpha-glucosyltransferase
MAVLEAWSYGLPVLMTPECNLPQGAACGAAIEIGTSPQGIAAGLQQMLVLGDAERVRMGAAGRRLVEERFAWARIADEMASVYEWVLCPGTRPASCVETCPA